ncbi:malate synthase [Thermobifida halotolerans]
MGAPTGVEITGPINGRYDEILTDDALALIADLHRRFESRRQELLAARRRRQEEISAGADLDFLAETKAVREDPTWRVAPPAPGIVDRRVEITGPTDRKMTINALNSGARVWLADFEDANTPLWENMIEGQLNLRDALDRTIDFTTPEGRSYALKDDSELATIVVRPRGWHLDEKHILVDGQRTSGGIVDFALYFFHCARRQLAKGKGPYFYLPKMQSHLEARLWNDIFVRAQESLGIERGTIRATVLIETIPAAFEMEEILYELREHSAGLNAGRWDYLFSIIKTHRTRGRRFLMPERNAVTMTAPFMRAYTELLVKTCHRRGAHAIGGMAAFIPSRRDPEVNKTALAKVRDDKTREAGDGFDGSWVAHPDLVPVAMEVFDGVLGERPNQIDRQRDDVTVTAADLLDVSSAEGGVTEAGPAQQHQRRRPVPGRVAGRQRRGGHPQPDGGRRHRGDLPLPDLAVAAQRRHPGQRRPGHRRTRGAPDRRGAGHDPRDHVPRRRPAGPRHHAVQGGRPGRRLRRVPHPARLRADAVTHGRFPAGGEPPPAGTP